MQFPALETEAHLHFTARTFLLYTNAALTEVLMRPKPSLLLSTMSCLIARLQRLVTGDPAIFTLHPSLNLVLQVSAIKVNHSAFPTADREWKHIVTLAKRSVPHHLGM